MSFLDWGSEDYSYFFETLFDVPDPSLVSYPHLFVGKSGDNLEILSKITGQKMGIPTFGPDHDPQFRPSEPDASIQDVFSFWGTPYNQKELFHCVLFSTGDVMQIPCIGLNTPIQEVVEFNQKWGQGWERGDRTALFNLLAESLPKVGWFYAALDLEWATTFFVADRHQGELVEKAGKIFKALGREVHQAVKVDGKLTVREFQGTIDPGSLGPEYKKYLDPNYDFWMDPDALSKEVQRWLYSDEVRKVPELPDIAKWNSKLSFWYFSALSYLNDEDYYVSHGRWPRKALKKKVKETIDYFYGFCGQQYKLGLLDDLYEKWQLEMLVLLYKDSKQKVKKNLGDRVREMLSNGFQFNERDWCGGGFVEADEKAGLFDRWPDP